MKKRILSILLVISVVLAIIPVTVFAGDFNGYTSLTDISGTLSAGKYYLKNNITLTSTLEITDDVTLDLNGKTIKVSTGNTTVITVKNDSTNSTSGTLTLYDSAGGGKITGGSTDKKYYAGGVYVGAKCVFNMHGGTIESCTTTAQNSAGGVYVAFWGTFNMYAGSIKSCSTTANYSAGGVYIGEASGNTGTFNMSGGTIEKCQATVPSNDLTYAIGCVGGVYNTGKFNMSGGTITLCSLVGIKSGSSPVYGNLTSSNSLNSAGVYNGEKGIFTIENGSITYCIATNSTGSTNTLSVGLGNAGTVYAHGGNVAGVYQFKTDDTICGKITKKSSQEKVTTFSDSVYNYAIIEVGTFQNTVNNYSRLTGGTYGADSTVANFVNGYISGGVFNGYVGNSGFITGGTFNGNVKNTVGSIYSGIFSSTSSVDSTDVNSYVYGGEFYGEIKGIYKIDFKVDGNVVETQWRKFHEVTKPSDPTASGKKFLGWYEENETDPFDFDEYVFEDTVLYAKYREVASVSKEPVVKAELTYNGEPQQLIESGATSTNGTVMYQVVTGTSSLAASKWTSDITAITAKDAGAYSIYYYVVGDGEHSDSEPKLVATVTVKKAENNSTADIGKTDETYYGKRDGTITGVSSEMEYRRKKESTYTKIDGTSLTGLEAGDYYVRYAETADYKASKDYKITIAEGKKLKVTVPSKANVIKLRKIELHKK